MKERYKNLDGIRAYAAIGIILMHVRANGSFNITGFIYNRFIASFTNLTYFFMLFSAFSMCCGYYELLCNNAISLELFYKRRYYRIWPYFAVLCTIEMLNEHNLTTLYEWFADLTLVFGLLPNAKISVVGVGWFIGVIFVFYMLFPFYCFLIGNKKRAVYTLAISIILNILCKLYFFDEDHMLNGFSGRNNILFCSPFFILGGLIYMYINQIKNLVKKHKVMFVMATSVCLVFYYLVSSSVYTMLILFTFFTVFGICGGSTTNAIFQNRAILFLAGVSMEIYLCHMFVFRFIEKIGLLHLTGNEVLNYVIVSFLTIGGAIVMAVLLRKIISAVGIKLKRE